MTDPVAALAGGGRFDAPVALVAAHPDDETLGLGAHLQRFSRLRLIHLTDGAPRDGADARRCGFCDWRDYAAARRRELDRALEVLGMGAAERIAYGLPDQAALAGLCRIVASLTRDLSAVAAVFTHPYEHGHPDHDTAALAVALACAALTAEGRTPPARFEFASYHSREGAVQLGRFWPDPACPEAELLPDPEALARKHDAIACYASQRSVIQAFPTVPERLRRAPDYDFRAAAPPGAAVYDAWGWAVTSAAWRRAAAATAPFSPASPCP